jgi:hypothetical protein
MAQTKLDLSDNKFEQLSNEILHLSGCTHVFGQFQLESGSTLSILPNHDTGKVLTSNSGGTATWQVIPTIIIPITGATNGLSVTDKKIKLGGQLTGNTTIDILTSDLNLCSSTNINRGISLNQTGNELKLSWGDASSACTASISVNDLNVSLSSVYSGGGCAAGLEITHVDNRICLSSTGSNKTYHDNRGFHYVCDYSGGADSRWLPDKGYVDSKLSGNTSASGERITKLICQVSHGFNVKDIIGWSGGTYNKAIANGLYDGEVIGIVSKCYNANCFDLTQSGYITGLTGLTTSTTYFLSDVTAGLLTSIEPTGNTHISKSVLIANSSTSGWVLPYAGYVITTGASAGGTWGSITGILSDQCDLQTCLNGKLASGGTALCATTAGNALKLNNQTASFYLNTGSTAICATCAGNASTLVGCTPSCFLGVNATAVCATCAIGAKNLCGCVPASFLLSGGTAVNSSKLGGQLPAYYLNTGSTALCSTSSIDSKGLCGCVPTCFLGVSATAVCATCAIGSKNLCGCVPASFLLSGGTAVCATCAGNSSTLVGCTPSCFLGTTACACDSKCLGGHLPAYYINTGTTITCAADSAKLNNKLPAYYLNTGSTALCATCAGNASTLVGCTPSCFLGATATAVCATCAIGAKNLCGCVPASFLLSGGTAVCSTCAGNASTVAGCTPSCFLGATACACDSKCLGTHLPAYYLTSGGTAVCATCAISSKALCGCVPASFLLSGGTAVCSTTAGNSLKLGNQLPAYYLNTGSTITATNALCLGGVLAAGYLLSGGTAKNSLCLNGHTEAALSVCNAVCVNGHAEANLSVANSACLGGNLANTYLSTTGCACDSKCFNAKLPAYYLNTGSTAICSTCAIGAKNLCGCVPASFLLSGGTAVCATCAVGAKNLCGCVPASFLLSGGTALCATTAGNALCLGGNLANTYLSTSGCACDSKCLGGHLPAYYLNTGSTITCAADSAKLNNKLPTYYLNTGSTALCATTAGNALALCSCVPSCFLGATACAADSAKLNNKSASFYLNTGSTALCATTAGNALCLGGNLANTYAPLASPNFTTCTCAPIVCATTCFKGSGAGLTGTAASLKSNDSSCLNGVLAAGYLLSGGTAVCTTTAGNALCLGGVLPAGYLLSGGTAKNSLCLGGALANTYAPLASPNFTTCTCAPIVCATTCFVGSGAGLTGTAGSLKVNDSSCLNGVLAAGYLLSGGTAKNSLCLGGALANTFAPLASPNFTTCTCAPIVCATTCFKGSGAGLTGTAASLKSNDSSCLGGVLPAGYLLSGGTAKNSLCLNGHTEAALSVCNSVCVNGHAEANLSVANSACLGGNLANTYAPIASPSFTTKATAPILSGTTCVISPIVCASSCFVGGQVKGTIITGSTCIESPVIRLTTGAGAGCVFTSNAAGCGIWCSPAAGGLAWSGTTANGVGTYVSASCIKSNPNMTFDGTKLGVTGNICASTCLCSPITIGSTCICGANLKLTSVAARSSETAITYFKSDGTLLSGTSKYVTVTLSASGWTGSTKQIKVTVVGVTTTNTITVYPPSTRASFLAYGNSQINCITQGTNTLTFESSNIPIVDLIVNILIVT